MVQFTKEGIVLTIPTESPLETWTSLLNSGYAVMENLLTIECLEKPTHVPFFTQLLFELSIFDANQEMKVQKFITSSIESGEL
jgi:hypothetical protein